MYTVKLKNEVQGRYNTYQVAMNHASDLIEDMGEIDDFSSDMVTINGKPYNYWAGY